MDKLDRAQLTKARRCIHRAWEPLGMVFGVPLEAVSGMLSFRIHEL